LPAPLLAVGTAVPLEPAPVVAGPMSVASKTGRAAPLLSAARLFVICSAIAVPVWFEANRRR
jgi:hypothetical protein